VVPVLEVTGPEDAPPESSAEERNAIALLHFEIGVRTHSAGLPTDGWYVAYRMARALQGRDEDGSPEPGR